MREFLDRYDLGEFVGMKGIQAGVTNTNYFVDTERGRYVLTIFETLKAEEIPFFLKLKLHLNQGGVACPFPIALKNGDLQTTLAGKPAALISLLNGADVERPNATQCRNVGKMLAKMHKAGRDFPLHMRNPRESGWWKRVAKKLEPKLPKDEYDLLMDEIAFLDANLTEVPKGIIHADLFKDNVLMDKDEVAGFIDFYYACDGSFIYDLCIALNDWARDVDTNRIDHRLEKAFMEGYESERHLEINELKAFNAYRRAAVIRFWVSRLEDYHFRPEGEMILTKDPNVFRDLLLEFRGMK